MSGDCPRALAPSISCDCMKTCSLKSQKEFNDKLVLKDLSRDELEIEYYNLYTKNECLTKALKDNIKQIKRMDKIARKNDEERRRGLSPTKQLYEDRISQLEQTNSFLQDKILVLRHQLQSHSRLHAKAHRNTSHHPRTSHSTKSNESHLSQIPIHVTENIDQQEKNNSNEVLNVDLVENDNRILQLESELEQHPNDASRVAENIELIRLRRLVKRQAAQLSSLNAHSELADQELEHLRNIYEQANLDNDRILKLLAAEKQKLREMQNESLELGNLKQDIKILQEHVRDLQNERILLRNNNDKLLEIASRKAEDDVSKKVEDRASSEVENENNQPKPVADQGEPEKVSEKEQTAT